jgi:hypothetical protein
VSTLDCYPPYRRSLWGPPSRCPFLSRSRSALPIATVALDRSFTQRPGRFSLSCLPRRRYFILFVFKKGAGHENSPVPMVAK